MTSTRFSSPLGWGTTSKLHHLQRVKPSQFTGMHVNLHKNLNPRFLPKGQPSKPSNLTPRIAENIVYRQRVRGRLTGLPAPDKEFYLIKVEQCDKLYTSRNSSSDSSDSSSDSSSSSSHDTSSISSQDSSSNSSQDSSSNISQDSNSSKSSRSSSSNSSQDSRSNSSHDTRTARSNTSNSDRNSNGSNERDCDIDYDFDYYEDIQLLSPENRRRQYNQQIIDNVVERLYPSKPNARK